MKCVGGKCLWTKLSTNKEAFQRRQSSSQIGLQVDYSNRKYPPLILTLR